MNLKVVIKYEMSNTTKNNLHTYNVKYWNSIGYWRNVFYVTIIEESIKSS